MCIVASKTPKTPKKRILSSAQRIQKNLKQKELYYRNKFRKENPDAIDGRYISYRTIKTDNDTTCEVCDVIISKRSVCQHVKSNHHIKNLNKIKDNVINSNNMRPTVPESEKSINTIKYQKYYAENKKHVDIWRETECVCECGATIRKDGLADHQKRNIHKKRLWKQRRIETAQGYG